MGLGALRAGRLRAGLVTLVAVLLGLVAVPSLASAATIPTTGTESYNASSPYAGLVISQFDPDVSTTSTASTFTSSFIQLFNAGSTPLQLQGLSLQDFSGTGLAIDQWGASSAGDLGPIELATAATPPAGGCTTTSGPVDTTGCLQPGQYYLLESSTAVTGSESLPVADQSYAQGFGAALAPETAAATSSNEGGAAADLFLVDGTADIGSDTAPAAGSGHADAGIVDAIATDTSGAPLFGTSTGPAPTALSTTTILQRADGGCTDTGNNATNWSDVTAVNNVPTTFAGVESDSTSQRLLCPDAATQAVFTSLPTQVSAGQPFTVKVADETPDGTDGASSDSTGAVANGDSSGTATLTATSNMSPVTLSCVDANNTGTTNGAAAVVQGYATFTCTESSVTSGTVDLTANISTSNTGESYFTAGSLTPALASPTVNADAPAVIVPNGQASDPILNSGLVIDTEDSHGGDGDPGYGFDFVDLFNEGTSPVSLNGLSVQYDQQSTEPIDDNPSLPCAYGWTFYTATSGSTCSTKSTNQAAGKVEWTEPLPDVVVEPGQSFLAAITGQNSSTTDPEAQDEASLPFAPDVAWNPTGYSSAGARIQVANNLIALVDGTAADTLDGTSSATDPGSGSAPAEPVVDSYTNFGENAGITESYYDPGVTYIRGEVGGYVSGAARMPYRLENGCEDANDNQSDFTVAPALSPVADGSAAGDTIAYVPQNQIEDMSDPAAPCASPTQLGFTVQPPSSSLPTSSMPNAFTVQVSSQYMTGDPATAALAGQDNSTNMTLGITPGTGAAGAQLTCVNSNAPYHYNSSGTLVADSAPTVEQELSGSNGLDGTQVTNNGNGTVSLQLVGGEATLDCSVDDAGTGYTLTASGTSSTYGTLQSATSKSFTVAAPSGSFDANSTSGLVISEVDNGGGEWYANESHPEDLNNWHNGFVELFNSGSQPISLDGLSTQFFDENTATSATGSGYTGCGATPTSCATTDFVPNDLQVNDQYEGSDGGGFPTSFPLHDVTLAPGQHYLIQGINNFESITDGGYVGANGTPQVPVNGGTYPASAFGDEELDLPVTAEQNDIRFEDSPEEGSMWLLVNGTTPMASVDLENPSSNNILSDQTLTGPDTSGPTVDQPVVDSMTQAGEDGRVVPGVTYSTGFPAPAQTTNGADEGYAYSRVEQGCQDTENNALDFAELWSTSVTPQNMGSSLTSCSAVEAASNVSAGLVIAGAYGGGGQTSSYYDDDFVEIENDSQSPISLIGDSLQYYGTAGPGSPATDESPAVPADDYQQVNLVPNATGSAGDCTSSTTGPVSQTGCLQPGQYYLVAGAGAGEGDGQPISPVPDQTAPSFSINWGPTADEQSKGGPGCPNDGTAGALVCDNGGMLLLADTTTELTLPQLPDNDAPSGDVIDALGIGTPLWSIGSPVAIPSDADGDFRNTNGCADTNNNSGDFTEGNAQHATLYNSNSAPAPCPANTGGAPIYAFGYTPSPSTSATPPVVNGETMNPAGIAIGSNGDTYLANTNANTVLSLPFPTSSALATTFAGSFEANGYNGDGGPATSATLSRPSGLAVDSAGDVFIADTDDDVVREVNTTGTISTVAGDGTAGYKGDGGQATSAELNQPIGLAVYGSGANETLYIADTRNDAIRAVNLSSGDITTVAGTPQQNGYAGDGGPATSALLNQPEGVAVDSDGNVFIADSGNNVIREVSENGASSGDITTVAGDYAAYAATGYTPADSGNGGPATSAQLDDPQAIAVDPAGDLFIADTYDNAIREVSAATGDISLLSDNPPTDPEGLAIDPSTGDLLVASAGSSEVTIISGGIQEGTGTAAGEEPNDQLAVNLSGVSGGSVASGAQFTVNVAAESQSGTADTGSSANVGLTLLSPPNAAPGTLNCGGAGSSSKQLSSGTATFTCSVTGPGTGYEIEATSAQNYESPGESAAFNVAYPVARPSDVTAESTNGTATIGWAQVNNATGYEIYDATASGAELATNPNDALTPAAELASQPVATVNSGSSTDTTIQNLDNGQVYDFVVEAVSASGNSEASQEVTATPVAIPTGVGAASGSGSATISWAPAEGATGYTVLVSTTSGGEQGSALSGCTASGPMATNCVVNGLSNKTKYYFEVEATNSSGTSGLSSEVSATPSTVPDAPTDVSGAAGNGQVTVSWTASDDEGSNVSGYSVYAATTAGGENTSGTAACTTSASDTNPPVDSCVIDGLTNGTSEFFVVVAANANGNSSPSAEASQTPSTVPGAPTGVGATVPSASHGQAGEIDLNWTIPTNDGGSPITGFKVYDATTVGGESLSGAVCVANSGTATSCTVTGLVPGLKYYFVVAAVNADGNSVFSSEVSATPAVDPDAPTGLDASAGSEKVALSWTAPTNPTSPVTSYSVYEATSAAGENLAGTAVCSEVTGTSCNVGNLTDGTGYYFVVVANLQDGSTAESDETSATPLAAPAGVTATAGNQQAMISWNADPGATGYEVLDSTTSGGENLTGATACTTTGTSCTVSGLTNGTAEYFVVVATDASGSSSTSAEASATPFTVPAAPGAVAVTPGNGQLAVTWTPPTDDGGSAITGYDVYVSTSAGAEDLSGTSACSTSGATSCTVTGLNNGTTYYVVVVADNAAGGSTPSAEQSTTPSTVPDAPAGVTVTATATGGANISWNAPASNGGSAITGYEVFSSTAKGGENLPGTPTCSTASTECSDTGLVPGTSYYFVVVASNADGTSVASSEVGVTTVAAAGAVTNLSAKGGDGTAQVSWQGSASGSATTYSVYVSTSQPVPTTGTPAYTGNGTSYTVMGLTNGTTYYIVVVTSASDGTSATSSTVSVVPTAPSTVTKTPPVKTTPKSESLGAGSNSTTVTEVDKKLKSGTKLTVQASEPGVKKPVVGSAKVNGDHAYQYKTGALPIGTTTVRFYEKSGKKLTLVSTEKVTVKATPAHESIPAGTNKTTVAEVDAKLKPGTKLTVKVTEPGHKSPVTATTKVQSDHDYDYTTGKLPVGTTTIEFYETAGGKLVSTEKVTVSAAHKKSRLANANLQEG